MFVNYSMKTQLGASGSTVQEVKVVNDSWDAVYVRSTMSFAVRRTKL